MKVEVIVCTKIAQAIIRFGEQNEVDLIVISSQGRSGLGRRAYGSVAERVVRHAPCSTLVVRRQEKVPKDHLIRTEDV